MGVITRQKNVGYCAKVCNQPVLHLITFTRNTGCGAGIQTASAERTAYLQSVNPSGKAALTNNNEY